ncbi:3-dehydroquinate synthase [Formosa algae]|uniref:3-dehydroquinate synthase n=1 Tax=Formosa algae TaxID=225843 RepID=A0A9X0YLM4_9FLAO|nr:3-dehydroquinate synthase [Formosa algae]MBP1840866.1 3-dehydroquinate synthase [Formosa algae]MDQ0336237.1 3-dehydroquinate synthase [Formosa algae]OEI80008.1 3-dehydroquinate synthase [Formosa algae]
MKTIESNTNKIHFTTSAYQHVNTHIKESNPSNIFIIVDENTHKLCLPHLLSEIETTSTIEIIEIESGEINKTIETCVGVWNVLSELGADRKSLVINLGGGVITDLGGFVASTFKRGITFINVPTTLLSMVDASVGGKTGVDLGTLKNQIGVINTPEMVIIDTTYLKTLAQNEMRSGLAEMLKHGLIQDKAYWDKFKDLSVLNSEHLDELIYESVLIKKHVVDIDPRENGLRKTLNYGHTIGHAIESYFLSNTHKTNLLHGEAIAIGMILASYISTKLTGLSEAENTEIKDLILSIYDFVTINEEDYEPIIELLKYDKKNSHGNINFVLLSAIGQTKIDCLVPNDLIIEALNFYNGSY